MYIKLTDEFSMDQLTIECSAYKIERNSRGTDAFNSWRLDYKDSKGQWAANYLEVHGLVFVMNNEGKTVETFNPVSMFQAAECIDAVNAKNKAKISPL